MSQGFRLEIRLISEQGIPDWNIGMFENFVNVALRSMYGIVGSSQLLYEIEALEPETMTGVLIFQERGDAER